MSQNRQAIAIAMSILMAVLPTTAVGLRLLARRIKKLQLGADDYIIVVALIFTLGLCVDVLIGAIMGKWGVHELMGSRGGGTSKNPTTSARQNVVRNQTIWILQPLLVLASGLTKLSVLLFYKRIFMGKMFRINTWILLILSLVWTVSFFFGNLLHCIPIQVNWVSNYSGKMVCTNGRPMIWAQVTSNVIIDALILTLPWRPVLKLQMPLKQKISVCGIFMLGGFVVAAGIVRCTTITTGFATSLDHSYTRCPGIYWAAIEAGVGVIGACLPTLRPLMHTSGVESLIRSVQRMIMSSMSRTKLTDHNDNSNFIRASSVDNTFVPANNYENRSNEKPYHIDVEAIPMQTFLVSTHGITIQSRVSQQEELV